MCEVQAYIVLVSDNVLSLFVCPSRHPTQQASMYSTTAYGYRSRCPSRNLLSFSQSLPSLPTPFFSSCASKPSVESFFSTPPPLSIYKLSTFQYRKKRCL